MKAATTSLNEPVSFSRFSFLSPLILQKSREKLARLEAQLARIRRAQEELATFFCESPGAFHLDEAFKIFANLSQRLLKATRDNAEREGRDFRRSISSPITTSPSPSINFVKRCQEVGETRRFADKRRLPPLPLLVFNLLSSLRVENVVWMTSKS